MSRASLLVSLLLALLALALGAGEAQATIYFRSSSTAQTGSGASSVTVNLPSDTVAGDVMIATVDAEGSTGFTAPSGWTSITAGATAWGYVASYYKIAGASEPASYTWSLGSVQKATGWIASYVGAASAAPVETSANASGNSRAPTTPSITTTAANSMLVLGASVDGAASFTITPPAGTTKRSEVYTSGTGSVVGDEMVDVVQAVAGASATYAFSIASKSQWVAGAAALKPGTGALAFSTSPKTPTLPTVALNGTAQTSNTTMNNFGVDDTTGSGAGWNVTVAGDSSAGKSAVFKRYCPNATCGTDSGPGYIAGGSTLPAGSLKLNSTGASFTTNGGSGTAPAFQCAVGCSVDAASATKIVSAAAAGGLGPWSTSGFGATSLALSTPTTTRILPQPGEIYHVDLVWTLNSGP